MDMTKEKFQLAYPDLFSQIVSEAQALGIKEGLEKGKAEGIAAGAEAERARIKAVEENSLPGHEALIQTLKFDGKTSGAEAAVKVLAAEKTILAQAHKNFEEDGKTVKAKVVDPPVDQPKKKIDEAAPIEERAEAEWQEDAKIRSEFRNDKAAYLAFRKAEAAGLAKIYKGGK